jgi:hypothetical protein
MDVRDAVEADAERLAEMTGSPEDVMRNLIHDRAVRVAHADDEVRGFVSYDAHGETVHVTQLEGDGNAPDRLLEEPVRFARTEDMNVELLVPEDESSTRTAAEAAGFDQAGEGPGFKGQRTVRYELDTQ